MEPRLFTSILPAGALLTLGACSDPEVVLEPFSEEGRVPVQIVAVETDCDGSLAEPEPLISTVADIDVATVEITPQCGVEGTSHQVLVSLVDPKSHESVVIGATLLVEQGDSEDTYSFDLNQDSAAPSRWGIELDSFGEPRIDTFVFQLLQAEQLVNDP